MEITTDISVVVCTLVTPFFCRIASALDHVSSLGKPLHSKSGKIWVVHGSGEKDSSSYSFAPHSSKSEIREILCALESLSRSSSVTNHQMAIRRCQCIRRVTNNSSVDISPVLGNKCLRNVGEFTVRTL